MKQLLRALIAGRAIQRATTRGRLVGKNPIDNAFSLMDEIAGDVKKADAALNGIDQIWRSKLKEFNQAIKPK